MDWHTWDSPDSFLAAAGDHLRTDVLQNQLLLGVAAALRVDPHRYGPLPAHLCSVHRGGVCVGALVQTPPWPLNLSAMPRDVAVFAAANLDGVRSVVGQLEAAAAFVAVAGAERTVTVDHDLGVFELRTVEPVRPAPGGLRPAVAGDARVLQAWIEAFRAEASPHDPAPDADAGLRLVERGVAWVWEDRGADTNGVVAWANFGREFEGYVSIGPVFTPVALRGRGYATNLVAAMSDGALARGHRGCTLFTDLSNPTSNAIYQRIGYRRVGTLRRYNLG